jgi:MFS family permease
VISFLVAATVTSPLFATLSTIFGRKPLLLAALAFLTCGSFIAAVTGNVAVMLVGRTVQGIGAGGIAVLSNLIVSDLVSAVDRRKWSGIFGTMYVSHPLLPKMSELIERSWVFGAITGPIIGDGLANSTMYRWVFWINLPFCFIAFLILPFFAQLKPASSSPVLPKIKNVDWVGYLLLSGSSVSVLLGLTWVSHILVVIPVVWRLAWFGEF